MKYVGAFLFGYCFPRFTALVFCVFLAIAFLFAVHARRDRGPSWVSTHGYFGGMQAAPAARRPFVPQLPKPVKVSHI